MKLDSEDDVAGKSTRITVDLGDEELVKALKIAAVEHRRTVRDIVVEALQTWLAKGRRSDPGAGDPGGASGDPSQPTTDPIGQTADKDYVTMMETLSRYRGGRGKPDAAGERR